jgi:hypothetical protein
VLKTGRCLRRRGFGVGPGTSCGHFDPERISVKGAVSEYRVAIAQRGEHVSITATMVCLLSGELERDRQAVGTHQRVDLVKPPGGRLLQLALLGRNVIFGIPKVENR